MKKFKIGDIVILIKKEECMPPLGSIGEVVGEMDEYGDYEVMFDNYPWRSYINVLNNGEGFGIGEDSWEIPSSYLMLIKSNGEVLKVEEKEYCLS